MFGGDAGRAVTRPFINAWTNSSSIRPNQMRFDADIYDRLDPMDLDYFRESREKRFGKTIEEMRDGQATALEKCDQAAARFSTIRSGKLDRRRRLRAFADYLMLCRFPIEAHYVHLRGSLKPTTRSTNGVSACLTSRRARSEFRGRALTAATRLPPQAAEGAGRAPFVLRNRTMPQRLEWNRVT